MTIERRKKQLREQAQAERAASLSTAPFIDSSKSAKPDFKQANDNPAQSPNKARTEAKAEPAPPTPKKSLKASQREILPPPEPSERLSLDDRKRISDVHLGDKKTLDRPWQRASIKEDRARPWQRDDKPAGRERKPPTRGGHKPK